MYQFKLQILIYGPTFGLPPTHLQCSDTTRLHETGKVGKVKSKDEPNRDTKHFIILSSSVSPFVYPHLSCPVWRVEGWHNLCQCNLWNMF